MQHAARLLLAIRGPCGVRLDAMYVLVNNKTYTNLTQLIVPNEIVMEVEEGAAAASTMSHEDP